MKITENFYLYEFACNDGSTTPSNLLPNIIKLAEQLQVLRTYFKKPIHINSAYRSAAYNRLIGGSPNSQHLLGKAADIRIVGILPIEIKMSIEKLIAEGRLKEGGLGIYDTFVHYDIRETKARWDKRKNK